MSDIRKTLRSGSELDAEGKERTETIDLKFRVCAQHGPKSILVEVAGGVTYWIPRSQIFGAVPRPNTRASWVTVTLWWAQQAGYIQ